MGRSWRAAVCTAASGNLLTMAALLGQSRQEGEERKLSPATKHCGTQQLMGEICGIPV
ncbi:hypothetical protein Q5P01_002174 [Channa striata]|uniref:Uncharacterized protein n=1 Tax=Channa striata TaxID=64152 RepID=A0AA88NM03_CHASR|nr:hypothetical protein Q5P01_002174 [Channa striata]